MKNWQAQYVLLTAAFLWGATGSQLSLLGVVLRHHAMREPAIAAVLVTMTIAIVVATLVGGTLSSRIGTLRTLMLGGAITLLAIIALPFTVDSPWLAALSRVGQGFGFGLFSPAGQLMTKALARDDDQIRAVGRFTAMFMIANLFVPGLSEWLLRMGEVWYFLMLPIPIAMGLGIMLLIPRGVETPTPANTAGYITLVRDKRQWLPNVVVMQSGLGYGFAASLLPLLLVQSHVPIAYYFTPFAIVLLGIRFVGLVYLQRLALPTLALLGLAAYASGFAALSVGVTIGMTVGAGCLFALGYAVIHPTCIEWASRSYPQAERARPVALINTAFNLGSIIAVQGTGFLVPVYGWNGALMVLGSVVFVTLCAVRFNGFGLAVQRPG